MFLTVSCKKIIEGPAGHFPDYSEHSYSGKVIRATDKVPLPGTNVHIGYSEWVTGDWDNLYLPYKIDKTVDFTTTDSIGKFYLFDSKKDDRATLIEFLNEDHLGASFGLDEGINDNYVIELYPLGSMGIYLTMPDLPSVEVSYSLESRIPVTYSKYNSKINHSYKRTFLNGVVHEYHPDIYIDRLAGCEYELTVKYQNHTNNSIVYLIPFDTVYYKVGFINSSLSINKMDLTSLEMPSITTIPVSSIGYYGASSGYEILANTVSSDYIFSRGIVWSRAEHPTVLSNEGISQFTDEVIHYELPIYNCLCGTTYYIRSFITTINGNIYGNEISFTTLGLEPPATVTCKGINLTRKTADIGALIYENPCSPTSAQGFCWSESTGPDLNDNVVLIEFQDFYYAYHLTGLTPNQTYYARPYAVNSNGTAFGEEISFTFPMPDSISDIDGNVYDIIKIGDQWWMAENLKTKHYTDGSDISAPGYFYPPGKLSENIPDYGLHYSWYAATSSHKLCPIGWHLPAGTEWNTLVDLLGGPSDAYKKMKEALYFHWMKFWDSFPENSSGFSARAAGITIGEYSYGIKDFASFWSSNEYSAMILEDEILGVHWQRHEKTDGLSVRCVKD